MSGILHKLDNSIVYNNNEQQPVPPTFSSVVYHDCQAGSQEAVSTAPCVNNFMSIGGSVTGSNEEGELYEYGLYTQTSLKTVTLTNPHFDSTQQ